jgi:hypothetical protein
MDGGGSITSESNNSDSNNNNDTPTRTFKTGNNPKKHHVATGSSIPQ